MALVLFRKSCSLLRNSAVIVLRYSSVKNDLNFASLSISSKGNQQQDAYQKEMWKRIKKNDPEMIDFLNSSLTRDRIKDLSQVMGCSIEDATELIKRDSPLGVTDFDNLQKRIKLLQSHNFTVRDIISNPSILHRTYDALYHRLAIMKSFDVPAKEISLSLFKKASRPFRMAVEKRFREIQFSSSFPSHQECIAYLFECDTETAQKLLSENQALSSVTPLLLKEKIDIMKKSNITIKVIQDSVRAIVYTSSSGIENRLKMLSDEDLLEFRELRLAYLLYCKKEDFDKCFDVLKNNRRALEGCRNKTEYLVLRLGCSASVAKELMSKKPISTMSELKLKNMIDFFLNEMLVTSDFIVSNFYLFGFSLERMQQRWPVISQSVNTNSRQISRLLTISDDQFEKFAKKNRIN